MASDDENTVQRMAWELQEAPPMEVGFRPATAFQLVGLVQLALRHPRVPDSSRETGERFIAATLAHFDGCPTVREVIVRGNDPGEDR